MLQVLIDPVCCLTCYPQLLYNFVYNDTISIQEALCSVLGLSNVLRFIISRDLIIAEVGIVTRTCLSLPARSKRHDAH